MIHSKTRKRSLIDTLSSMGFSISYNRVDEIQVQTTLTKQICYKYQTDQLVRTPTHVDNALTTASIDNVDHNATLNKASNHFHRTSMSLFQHGDVAKDVLVIRDFICNMEASQQILELPINYTDIPPTAPVRSN